MIGVEFENPLPNRNRPEWRGKAKTQPLWAASPEIGKGSENRFPAFGRNRDFPRCATCPDSGCLTDAGRSPSIAEDARCRSSCFYFSPRNRFASRPANRRGAASAAGGRWGTATHPRSIASGVTDLPGKLPMRKGRRYRDVRRDRTTLPPFSGRSDLCFTQGGSTGRGHPVTVSRFPPWGTSPFRHENRPSPESTGAGRRRSHAGYGSRSPLDR
jgi:hypothetical protein